MVMSAGLVKVGGVLSCTVIICTWLAAALPQLSASDQVRVMTLAPGQFPLATASEKVAFNPVEQLSASSVTSPVAVTDASLSLIHISEPTRQAEISYAVFCLKKKK